MNKYTVNDIADKINGLVIGDGLVKINGVAGIRDAQEGEITFLANKKYIAHKIKRIQKSFCT